MSRSILVPLVLALAVAACGEQPPLTMDTPVASDAATPARERLAARLAVALADPALRRELAERFVASTAPEGKLQFQALARADNNRLVARLASTASGSVAELLDDLVTARDLELYLPVASQRTAWQGDAAYLVATAADDGDTPVAFDAHGNRTVLSRATPPTVPVIALVPQETDFAPRPAFATCYVDCDADGGGGWSPPTSSGAAGLYLVATDFDQDFESWLKGAPEFEFHVYGEVLGKAQQLACTSEVSGRDYAWNADATSWRGSVALLTQADIDSYLARNPTGVIRVVAWEDDDQPCVPVSDGAFFSEVQKMVDELFKRYTGAKTDPLVLNGVRSAYAAWGLAEAVRNLIAGEDDLIGLGIERSIAGWAPGTANFILKGDGAITQGSFETAYRR